jgi:REP element-mobilizing transposase RayT
MSLFKDTYRIETTRLPDYDYSQEGAYYITICTNERKHYFGEILDDKIHLNQIGTIAKDCLKEIPKYFPYAKTDFFVIMPNHIHLILFINDTSVETRFIASKKNQNDESANPIETRFIASKNETGGFAGQNNPMLNNNLSRIIRWYKGRISYESRKIISDFSWQPRFYEHIIRNDTELFRVREYIMNNPLKWSLDKYNIDI